MKGSFAVLALFLSTYCFAQTSTDQLQSLCDNNDSGACIQLGTLFNEGKEVQQSYENAKIFFEKACSLNDQNGCVKLGELYKNGNGVPPSLKQANALFKKACDLNNGYGCFNLASSYYEGQGFKKNYKTAFGLFSKGCDLEYGQSCVALGNMYRAGQGTKASNAKAVELNEKACNLNTGAGCNNLGKWAYNGNVMPQSFEKSAEYYEKACALDVPRSCNNLGHMYENGNGVPQNYARARQLYEKSCSLDSGQGCVSLGSAEFRGIPDDQSYEKATESFAKACELGISLACNYLANSYQFGLGVPQSTSKAKEYYEKACKEKNGLSCFRLGLMAENGTAGKASYINALNYYEQSCKAKDPSGCQKVGLMYEDGEGVEPSLEKANEYFDKARNYSAVLQAIFTLNNEDKTIDDAFGTIPNTEFSDTLLKLQTACTRLSDELNSASKLHLVGFNVAPAFYIEGLSVSKMPNSTNDKIFVRLDNYQAPLCKLTYTREAGYAGEFNYQYLLDHYGTKLTQQSVDFLKLRLADQQESQLVAANTALAVNETPSEPVNPEPTQKPTPPAPAKHVLKESETSFEDLDQLIGDALEKGEDISFESTQNNDSPKQPKTEKTNDANHQDDIEWLINAKPDLSLSPFGETEKALNGSNQFRKEEKLKEMTGKVVVWRLPAEEIKKAQFFLDMLHEEGSDDLYYLFLWSHGTIWDLQAGRDDKESISVAAFVTPLNEEQKQYLNNLNPGTWVTIKGLITGKELISSLVMRPAILWDDKTKP